MEEWCLFWLFQLFPKEVWKTKCGIQSIPCRAWEQLSGAQASQRKADWLSHVPWEWLVAPQSAFAAVLFPSHLLAFVCRPSPFLPNMQWVSLGWSCLFFSLFVHLLSGSWEKSPDTKINSLLLVIVLLKFTVYNYSHVIITCILIFHLFKIYIGRERGNV